jgi:hypothetical protein
MGFFDSAIDNLADRLVDSLVTCSDIDVIGKRIHEQLQAGPSRYSSPS